MKMNSNTLIRMTRRVFAFLKPFHGKFKILFLIIALGQALSLSAPYLFGKLLDNVIKQNQQESIILLVITFVVAMATAVVNNFRERYQIKNVDDSIDNYIEEESFKNLSKLSVGQHMHGHSYLKLSAISKGKNSIKQISFNLIFQFIPNIIEAILITVILLVLSPMLGVIALVFAVAQVILLSRLNINSYPWLIDQKKFGQEVGKTRSEFYRNFELVLGDGQEKKAFTIIKEDDNSYMQKSVDFWLKYIKKAFGAWRLGTIGSYIIYGIALFLILNGHLTAGFFVSLFMWLGRLNGAVGQLVYMQRKMMQDVADAEILFLALDTKPEIDINEFGFVTNKIKGDIEFSGISYSYAKQKSDENGDDEDKKLTEGDETIKNFSFRIDSGMKVGIVGHSGSGKTTLVNLLRRYFDPIGGVITIDDIPLKDYNLTKLRSHIGNVSQDILVFDKSLRENVLFGVSGDGTLSDEEIMNILRMAQLDSLIERLPAGLSTYIGERGIKLSGGERQRLAIARAIAKNPDIFIFDEATSALDSLNEQLIHKAIKTVSAGKTTIIIAHRLSTVIDADMILVMRDGEIVASGTHEELLKNSSEYQSMIKHQQLTPEISLQE